MFRKEAVIMVLFFVGIVVLGLVVGLVGPRLFGPVQPVGGRAPLIAPERN
jgi:hypothetical protein